MYHFQFLKRYRTYIPSYRYDFIKFTVNSFLFGMFLESYLIYFNRYEKIYSSSFNKELEKTRDLDNKIEDRKRMNILKQQKLQELNELESKLNSRIN